MVPTRSPCACCCAFCGRWAASLIRPGPSAANVCAAAWGGEGAVAATLAGCRLVSQGESVLVCREPARMADAVPLVPGDDFVWDGRMHVKVPADLPPGLFLGGLGRQGWRLLRGVPPVPAAARPSLPVLTDSDGVFAVPHLGYNRDRAVCGGDWISWNPATSDCLVPAWTGII